MQKNFFDLLKEENKKGATILFSSHILSEVQKLCDRVAIIKEGKLVQVEKISTLKEKNYKKIRMETKENLDIHYFNIAGVSQLEIKENMVSFMFNGNINLVLKKIADIEIANLWVEELTLEEIFLHFYEKED